MGSSPTPGTKASDTSGAQGLLYFQPSLSSVDPQKLLLLAKKLGLVLRQQFQNRFPFRKARLVLPRKGKPYVILYVWNIDQNILTRKRDYEVSSHEDKSELKAFAKQRIKEINQLLEEGFHIDDSQSLEILSPTLEVYTLKEALRNALTVKLPELKERTKGMYESALNDSISFLQAIKKANLPIAAFTKKDVFRYSDYLMTEEI